MEMYMRNLRLLWLTGALTTLLAVGLVPAAAAAESIGSGGALSMLSGVANSIPGASEGRVMLAIGPPDPCVGKSTQYLVKDFQTKNDGVVHLRCGAWNGRSGWGFR